MVALGEKYWGSKESVDSVTETGKAQTTINIQDQVAARSTMIACDWGFPIYFSHNTPDRLGPASYDVESRLLSAVTGRTISGPQLKKISERSFVLHRATEMKRGRKKDEDLPPDYLFTTNLYPKGVDVIGPGGKNVKVANPVMDRSKFMEMLNEYYKLRGWDVATGMPTRKNFEDLDLKDVADTLASLGRLPG
jgi:aldehyde:ferredoxin oxidoreductase